MSRFSSIALITLLFSTAGLARPSSYTELLDYVQEAPDQGDTNTCLFVASTGAMELIANKLNGIKNPQPFGPFDLAESYVINAPATTTKAFFETPVLKFNRGFGYSAKDWPFEAFTALNNTNNSVWNTHPQISKLPKVTLPEIETIKLFQFGGRWSTYVLNETHVEAIKEALWKYKSPVIVNYNDEDYWHVILIVGYDDNLPGECYDTDSKECEDDIGSFYVRDSFGVKVELRDYDWFRVKGNAAAVVKAK
jgi:C1A family cysteine protease